MPNAIEGNGYGYTDTPVKAQHQGMGYAPKKSVKPAEFKTNCISVTTQLTPEIRAQHSVVANCYAMAFNSSIQNNRF
jgi:hypothetical protein